MICCNCGNEITTLKGVSYAISGFEQEREQGGTNHVLWRERTGDVMCADCTLRRKHNVDDNQLSLIGWPPLGEDA